MYKPRELYQQQGKSPSNTSSVFATKWILPNNIPLLEDITAARPVDTLVQGCVQIMGSMLT